MPDQVLATGLTALGTVLLLSGRSSPGTSPGGSPGRRRSGPRRRWAGCSPPATWVLVPGVVVLVAGLGTQLLWAFRRGRYLEDDVRGLWRRLRGRPAPQAGRHRVRDDG